MYMDSAGLFRLLGDDARLRILRVDLAAGKDVGATQHIGQTMPLDQEGFQPAWAVAQHHHGRRRPHRPFDGIVVGFHRPRLADHAVQARPGGVRIGR
jgi:hypothetical protein